AGQFAASTHNQSTKPSLTTNSSSGSSPKQPTSSTPTPKKAASLPSSPPATKSSHPALATNICLMISPKKPPSPTSTISTKLTSPNMMFEPPTPLHTHHENTTPSLQRSTRIRSHSPQTSHLAPTRRREAQ